MTAPAKKTPRHTTRLADERGISLIIALGITFVTALLLVAVFTATRGETHLVSVDAAEKKAYYAAEAGIASYENNLTQDGNYLTYCTEPPTANASLNQYYKEGTSEPLSFAELAQHTARVPETGETYAIQLLPAESAPTADKKCDRSRLVETMLEETGAATGTFRIESTGFYEGHHRSLIATFRNANFVSYVWYTKYETFDPAMYGSPTRTECEAFYGKRPGESKCLNNYFISGESVKGPMHTEDHVGVCGSPVFGRTATDRIEFGSAGHTGDEGFSVEGDSGCGGGAKPQFSGTHILPAEVKSLEPPPGDEELLHIVEPSYEFTGKTEIELNGNSMNVTKFETVNKEGKEEVVAKTTTGVPFPPNGVIYVAGGCSEPYSPYGPKPLYTKDTGCGNVYVRGEYSSSLTIAAQNDVVIDGNIYSSPHSGEVPSGNAMLGLIANNFVRIYHPVAKVYSAASCKSGDKSLGSGQCEYKNEASGCDAPNILEAKEAETEGLKTADLKNPTIDAAILALKHAVLVDNFNCGAANLEHLNVFGAIAGLFSNGLTGQFNGSTGVIEHGYPYNANYDDRLQISEPPHFLNPIQAAWYIQRQTLSANP